VKIYFAGSIRGGRNDQQKYFKLIEFLATRVEVLTEHVGDSKLDSQGEKRTTDQEIFERDKDWLQSCDAVVAEVTNPSLGVGYEIGIAEKLGKPVLCLFDEKNTRLRLSAMVSGNPQIQVSFYSSLRDAENLIIDFIQRHSG
jgi:nucleoside 2-deoxyribosyltransferase